MKLAQLFSAYPNFKMGEHAMSDVQGLCLDSRSVTPGQVFFAVRGTNRDSHDYLPQVCRQGAIGVVVEDASLIPPNYAGAVLVVPNSREAVVRLASRYYNFPADQLFCVGVTGTNGKTSTTYMIESVLNRFGLPTGVLGTINHHFQDKVWGSELTTPDPITLQKRLHEFVALGAKAAAFEVSSHAIDQGRAAGLPWSTVVFTNLTRDHLDYHKSMENYFLAKEKLFREMPLAQKNHPVTAIININDEWGRRIQVAPNVKVWTYGESQADFQFQVLDTQFSGTRFRLNTPRGEVEVTMAMPGRHNVYNAVAAMAVGMSAGASLDMCVAGVQNFMGVPGRLQKVATAKEIHVFVDYAHTDDALRTVLTILQGIRQSAKARNKIITVFGCGGDRDKGKRPLMAKAAIELSDYVYVTSDNPRTEDPMSIIQDIVSELPNEILKSKVIIEVDRREAIGKAIRAAHATDVVLIAGKGHEDYQIIGDKKTDFSDVQVAEEFLNGV